MNARRQASYGEYRVLTASRTASVRMLYDKMISNVETARECLRNKDPEGRARNVSAAFSILTELAASLDHEVAPELSGRLKALYEYMQWLLVTGHSQRDDRSFQEAEGLLRSLREAWVEEPKAASEEAAPSQQAVRPQPHANPYGSAQVGRQPEGPMYL